MNKNDIEKLWHQLNEANRNVKSVLKEVNKNKEFFLTVPDSEDDGDNYERIIQSCGEALTYIGDSAQGLEVVLEDVSPDFLTDMAEGVCSFNDL